MAIKKIVTYEVQCEGPCGKLFHNTNPKVFYRVKIEPAVKDIGRPLEYKVATLCQECVNICAGILFNAGIKLKSPNEEKKEAGE